MFSLKLGLNSCAKSFCLANWLSGCLNFRQKSSQNSMPSFASENNLILKFVNRKNAYHSIRLLFFLSFFLSLSLSLSLRLSFTQSFKLTFLQTIFLSSRGWFHVSAFFTFEKNNWFFFKRTGKLVSHAHSTYVST
jgi:hypothetical protein